MALRAFRSITKVTATRAGQRRWHEHCEIDLRSFKGYVVVGGTGALPAIARLREATDEAKQKLKGMRQRGLRHPLRCFVPLRIEQLRIGSKAEIHARTSDFFKSQTSSPIRAVFSRFVIDFSRPQWY
jgi:hypothetical protein